ARHPGRPARRRSPRDRTHDPPTPPHPRPGPRHHITPTSTQAPLGACWTRVDLTPRRPQTRQVRALRIGAARSSLFSRLLPREGGQEPVAEGVHPPDRSARAGPEAVLPAPPGDPVQNGPVAGDDRDRDVPAGARTGDERGRLMVAEEYQYEIVVAVFFHIRDEGGQRVLDGLPVGGAEPAGATQHGA